MNEINDRYTPDGKLEDAFRLQVKDTLDLDKWTRDEAIFAELRRLKAATSIDCPACGETVKQVSSATLSLALWQHWNWVCAKRANDSRSHQMTDIYGVAIDVHPVRTFRDGRGLGAGYILSHPATWFVYDRENTNAKWHQHCGPYSTFDQAKDWIMEIRE
jgi:hypothetical protein